jgi:hypothetical protein
MAPLNVRVFQIMKLFAAIGTTLLITVGAANAGEIVITPKASDSVLVFTIRGGEVVKAGVVRKSEKHTGAANAEEFVMNPKTSGRAVVLTIGRGKVVKASVIAEPEPAAKLEHLKDTAAFAPTP